MNRSVMKFKRGKLKKFHGWVNVYTYRISSLFESKKAAIASQDKHDMRRGNYLATIKMTGIYK